MKIYEAEFTVEGSGVFPFDMLRYNSAFPKGSRDAAALGDADLRKVTLIARAPSPAVPTVDRWNSFTWRVIAVKKSPY